MNRNLPPQRPQTLADEMGLFSDDRDRLGMLSQMAYRAARLVVDPGLHALRVLEDGALPMPALAAKIERWIGGVEPGSPAS